MEKITLFRGDSEKIKEFDVKKTHRYCLVGPGIYLTNALTVAESYMDKGSKESNSHTLFQGEAKDRPAAFKAGFQHYVTLYIESFCPEFRRADKKSKAYLNLVNRIEQVYKAHIDNRSIIAEYPKYKRPTASDWEITVTYTPEKKVGFITRFEFPKKEFETGVMKIDGHIKDEFFWELIWDNQIGYGDPYDTKHDFIKNNAAGPKPIAWRLPDGSFNRTAARAYPWHNTEALLKIRNILVPYGYHGYEYNGGQYAGGKGLHRAFVIWDDEFVNDHKVERFK